ncbi:SPBc2 prophage-derived uncharacterized protein YomR [Bacillus subtilis]|uniref:hypothetical protein n=1 Tax=Bacillus subtilis TaxID=1423 RepID=UPI00084711F2|nr:hypothetical protein [Bacillus subtilis]AOL97971.1 SPBc2 prophage-derived uncharacterized protein YomR [Bacillus subtilis]
MSSSKFVGQLKQNNIQINNLKDSLSRTEKHMTDYETELSKEINSFMERQNFDLKSHTEDINNPHKVTKTQVGLDKVLNVEQASKTEFDLHASDIENPHNVTATQIGLSNLLNEKQATKVEFDDHVKNLSNPHSVTKEQIGLGNVTNVEQASKIIFDNHASDKTIHVTVDDRNKWNTAEANAKAYTDVHAADTVKHITATERTKWNGAQLSKITADLGGVSIAANEGEDILKKIVDQGRTMGTFYAHGKAINAPSTASTRGIFHLTGLASDGKGMYGWVYATDYKNNVFTNYYDGSTTYWQGWKRSLNTDDLLYSYANITLKNGATAGTRTPTYSKNGGVLLLRGHVVAPAGGIFGTIPTTHVPTGGAVVNVSVSGTSGYAKLIIYENGDLKITDVVATDSNAITGYWLDVPVSI